MTRKLKNMENETHTLYYLECVEKHAKTWKMTNVHCRIWSMTRKLKIMENEEDIL